MSNKTIEDIVYNIYESGGVHCKYVLADRETISPDQATKAITQAMLDAVPKKIKAKFEDDDGGKKFASGHNFAIDQMESAIKLMGGSDE